MSDRSARTSVRGATRQIPTDNFSPVRPTRAFEKVASRIRAMVADGILQPGDKLPGERELCERLSIGRSALREALRMLESSGLLEIKQGKDGGAFITSGNANALSGGMRDFLHLRNVTFAQLAEARLMVTRLVVATAVEHATDADLLALENNVTEAEALFLQGRLMDKTFKNIEFHEILARSTQNPIMELLVHTLNELFRHFIERLGSEMSRDTFASRARFLKAMRAGDVERAVSEMDGNLRNVHQLYATRSQEASAKT